MPRKSARAINGEQAPYSTRPGSDPTTHQGASYWSQTLKSRALCASAKIVPLSRKAVGAYYTPDGVVGSLTRWAVRSSGDRMLDPACGDGRFIAQHANSVGIEQDLAAALQAADRAGNALVQHADFFDWAATTTERFDCAVGNPPFIRYQHFKGKARESALSVCAAVGVSFSGLTSSWAPFLVATATLLRPGGRMAFVVPAEIGHAPYAAPLLEYLVRQFAVVHIVAVRSKIFPDLSEDCWLLYADRFGAKASEIQFTALDRFYPSVSPPHPQTRVPLGEWRAVWKRRLRPLLLPWPARQLYEQAVANANTTRFGELASIGIGYVSGGNDFFHLRPSQAAELGLPPSFLRPSVRNGRFLTTDRLTSAVVEQWRRADEPVLLLNIPKKYPELPQSVRRYLGGERGLQVQLGYKCRNRQPWYSVPDVHVPDFFLTYLSGRSVSLVRNDAGITCTNALHYVRLKDRMLAGRVIEAWQRPFTRLSCEIEGHPLGGGVLKLEPREASAVLLPPVSMLSVMNERDIADAIAAMQSWRHYC
jgi:adenine-specific DNA-methyltransferase